MSGHTEGPWTVKDMGDGEWTVESTTGYHLMRRWERGHISGMPAKDARLIAAAPAMREALEALVEEFELTLCGSQRKALRDARAALALANPSTDPK